MGPPHPLVIGRFFMKRDAIRLAKLGYRLAAVAGAVFVVMQASALLRSIHAKKQYHTTAFRSAPRSEAGSGTLRVLTGRILASGSDFSNTIEVAAVPDWLLALRRGNVLTALNLRTGLVKDVSALLANNRRGIRYDFLWVGPDHSQLFLGGGMPTFITASLNANGVQQRSVRTFVRPKASFEQSSVHSLPLAGGVWASNGFFQDGVTLIVDELEGIYLSGHREITKPVFPGITQPSISEEANKNVIAARPDGKRLAQAFRYAPTVYVYDGTGAFLRSVAGPVSIKQAFGERLELGNPVMRFLPETTYCYIGITATNDNIIALFSGERPMPGREMPVMRGSQLHVLTWDGVLAEIIDLDGPVSWISASPDGRLLWAVRLRPVPAVIEYKLH